MPEPLRILFAVSEVSPFSKTGGLGDVASSLPRALAALGHDVRVVTPRYRSFAGPVDPVTTVRVSTAQGPVAVTVGRTDLPGGVPVYSVADNRGWFDRDGLYQSRAGDYPDNLERFAFFSRAAIALPTAIGWHPQIIHCNDWQTALIPLYLAAAPQDSTLRTVLTIHNMGFHGSFPADQFPATGLADEWSGIDGVEFFGRVNLLKGGLLAADVLTTVSPTYAREIQAEPHSYGLHGVLATRQRDLVGILNGIDREVWNPETDPVLATRFSASQPAGRPECRADLLRRLNLAPNPAAVLGMVTRLTQQKGIDLVLSLLPELLQLDVRIVILGTGDPAYEASLREWTVKHPDRIAAVPAFDEPLAHRIMAGVDVFLMPSRYEPCGLSQLYAMRYGAVPVAHQTGGLADTIVDYTPDSAREQRATGFLFRPCTADNLLRSIQLALAVRRDRTAWKRLVASAMRMEFGWDQSAAQYAALYRRALAQPGRRSRAQ